MNEDMRGCAEDEFEAQYYCRQCDAWFNYEDMYNDRICEKCYYTEI